MPRLFFRLLFVALVSLSSLSWSGCAVSEEDRDFYYRGWVRPTDLDRKAPSHLGPRAQQQTHYQNDPLID